jgi:hypothetical protein
MFSLNNERKTKLGGEMRRYDESINMDLEFVGY